MIAGVRLENGAMKTLEEGWRARSVSVNVRYIPVAKSGNRISTVIEGKGSIEGRGAFAHFTGQACVQKYEDRRADAEIGAWFEELFEVQMKARSHLTVHLH